MTWDEAASVPAVVAAHNSNGALAAARDLGRAAIPVVCPRPPLRSPVRFSRYVSDWEEPYPGEGSLEARFQWLMAVGRRHPGSVLMPAMDDLTWLIASRQSELESFFKLYYPPGDVLLSLLDKEMLARAAASAGIAVPTEWFLEPGTMPSWEQEVTFPAVVKLRTHVGLRGWFKGRLVNGRDDLVHSLAELSQNLVYDEEFQRDHPASVRPFVQAFLPGASSSIYNLAGFIDHTGVLARYSASHKLMQYPRRFGVGVCFEAAPVDRELTGRLTELLRSLGFYGMVEAEFVAVEGQLVLIDVNPRIFNGLSLATSRGLRLPLLWYLAALGRWSEVEEHIKSPAPEDASVPAAWCHRFALETLVACRLLTARMTPGDAYGWMKWVRRPRSHTLEASWEPDDPWPGRLNGLQHIATFLRDPRYFVGTFVKD